MFIEELLESPAQISIFYHGSDSEIDVFTLDKLATGTGYDEKGPGIYLTSSESDARMYGKYVHKVTVKIPKSRLLQPNKKIGPDTIRRMISLSPDKIRSLQNWDENPVVAMNNAVESIFSSYSDDYREACHQIWFDFYYPDHTIKYLNIMIRWGWDGFLVPKREGVVHLIVFNPARLKVLERNNSGHTRI